MSRKYLWTWGGKFVGHREGDDLWTHDGRHVGRFHGDEVFAQDGDYLGELYDEGDDRLITRTRLPSGREAPFVPHASRVGYAPLIGYIGNMNVLGYQEFPSPDKL
jgi:hypothetical protein